MKTIEVVAAIIKRGNEVLATQRGYGEFEGGWEFPGGKVEPGESPEGAVVREIQEELDATVAVDCLITTVEYDYPTFHLVMHCYLSHVAAGELKLLEHSAAKWLTRETLDSVDWLPADVAVIDAIKDQGVLG